jgi:hypothetical protein
MADGHICQRIDVAKISGQSFRFRTDGRNGNQMGLHQQMDEWPETAAGSGDPLIRKNRESMGTGR